MHITGILKAYDSTIRYDQNNNSTEKMNKSLLLELLADLKQYPIKQWESIIEKMDKV